MGFDSISEDGATLSLRGFLPPWLALALFAAGALLAFWLYRTEAGRVAAWKRALLAGLRLLLLASIALLACKPTLTREEVTERPRPIVLLVDDTQSMTQKDLRVLPVDRWRVRLALNEIPYDQSAPADAPADTTAAPTPAAEGANGAARPSRLELVQAVLRHPRLDLLKRLAAVAPLQPAKFGQGRTMLDAKSAEWVGALRASEPRTALADSIADLLRRDPSEVPAAIILCSDGRENASRATLADVAAQCKLAGVPVHVYVPGSSAEGQIQLRDFSLAEAVFVDDTAVIPVRFRGRGFKDAQVELTARLGGREVARKVVPLVSLAGSDDQRESLSFVPAKGDALPSKQDFTVGVRVVTDLGQAADEKSRQVRVIDRKLQVLVAENQPRWDYKFLQRALQRDRRVEASFYLASADRETSQGGPPYLPAFPASQEELAKYDLIVLGDLSASAFSPTQLEALKNHVAEGGGLITIAGRQAPSSWVGTPLAEVLPVELSGDRSAERPREPFSPVLTPSSVRQSALKLDDDPAENAKIWAELPGLTTYYAANRLKPATDVLLAHPSDRTADGKPMPLVATHYYGKGFVVFSAIDETWRWRYNKADAYFGRYWSQLIYLAGAPRTTGTRFTQLALDSPDPLLGQLAPVYARLLRPDSTPQTVESVEGVIEQQDAPANSTARTRRVTFRRLPGQPGEYSATVPFNQVGSFTLTVDNAGSPGQLEYRVSLPPDHELAPGAPDEAALAQLASDTGGKLYREEQLDTLPGSVLPQVTRQVSRAETVLWNRWALLWLVLVWSAEWVVRRAVSLS